MRSYLVQLAGVAAALLVLVIAIPRAVAIPSAPATLSISTGVRELGWGQVRFNGRGPEAWAWETELAERHVATLQQTVARLRLQLRERRPPTVAYALKLAALTYGVPLAHMRTVAWCESRLDPAARNGAYRGIFQMGPMFERTIYGQAGFSVWDPVAAALAAARTVDQEGWQQWTCKP